MFERKKPILENIYWTDKQTNQVKKIWKILSTRIFTLNTNQGLYKG